MRAIEAATARVGDIPTPVLEQWNAATMDVAHLPWLAWSLSIDRWDPEWSEERKRLEVARAIELHRTKGTPASIDAILADWDELLHMVEWWEAGGSGVPHTFEVIMPVDGAGGDRVSAATSEAIIRDVVRYKPLRSHFAYVHSLPDRKSVV
jgi:phage tail P2-like protein